MRRGWKHEERRRWQLNDCDVTPSHETEEEEQKE